MSAKRNEKTVPVESVFQVVSTGTYLGCKELIHWLLSKAEIGGILLLADMLPGDTKQIADLGEVKRVV